MEDHARAVSRRGLRIALALTVLFLGLEVAGGLLSRSLALLADAGHMASDAGALGLSLFAFWLSTKPRSLQRTFGWFRFEIFAALLNGLTLWLVSGLIAWEAVRRFRSPLEIESGSMLLVAAVGLAVNLVVARILHAGRKENLNSQGAFLHVVGDAAGSVGVIAAAAIIRVTGWRIVDPLVSLLLCGLIGWSAWRLVREAFHILMEGTPDHLNLEEIRSGLAGIPGVRDIHDLHIWTITSGFIALTVHITVDDLGNAPAVLAAGRSFLAERLGIKHSTIQIESPSAGSCATDSCD